MQRGGGGRSSRRKKLPEKRICKGYFVGMCQTLLRQFKCNGLHTYLEDPSQDSVSRIINYPGFDLQRKKIRKKTDTHADY